YPWGVPVSCQRLTPRGYSLHREEVSDGMWPEGPASCRALGPHGGCLSVSGVAEDVEAAVTIAPRDVPLAAAAEDRDPPEVVAALVDDPADLDELVVLDLRDPEPAGVVR